MKYLLLIYILFTFYSVGQGDASQNASSLKTDLDELEAMIPEKQIKKLTEGYAIHDLQFWKLAIYVKSSHFRQLWVNVLNQTGVEAFIDFGEAHGVDIVHRINKIADKLGLPEYPVRSVQRPARRRLKYRKGGLLGYLHEVEGMLPLVDLKKKYDEKYQENPTFKDFFELLNFDEIHSYFTVSPGLDFVTYLTKYNVDWHEYFNKARAFFEIPHKEISVIEILE